MPLRDILLLSLEMAAIVNTSSTSDYHKNDI